MAHGTGVCKVEGASKSGQQGQMHSHRPRWLIRPQRQIIDGVVDALLMFLEKPEKKCIYQAYVQQNRPR